MSDHPTGEHAGLPIDPDLDADDPAAPVVQPPRRHPTSHQHRARPALLMAIALGGMMGATGRYAIGRWLPSEAGRLPWATLITNLAGSLLLGVALVLLLERFPGRHGVRAFGTTGVLGAFTTMSTLAVETALLVADGHPATGLAYLAASVAGGLVAVAVGMAGGRALVERSSP